MKAPVEAEFYLVCLPGLEDLSAAELLDWYPKAQPQIERGGMSFLANWEVGLALNQVLKTPTRILARISQFRCRDFPTLYKAISTFPWRRYLDPQCDLNVTASVHGSRLKITKRVEETAMEAWLAYQKHGNYQCDNKKVVELYIRVVNDDCTLSLDTSGEALYKRGVRRQVGDAPLRETIAAALIQWMGRVAHGNGDIEIVDPMMGSGVFLLEAGFRDVRSVRPFAFEHFNKRPLPDLELSSARPNFDSFVGFEVDQKTLSAAKVNLKSLGQMTVLGQDIFSAAPLPETSHERWLFCNPPYGERIKVQGDLREYYAKLLQTCEKVVRPKFACFLFPAEIARSKFPLPSRWQIAEKRFFENGGLPVAALIFQIVRQ